MDERSAGRVDTPPRRHKESPVGQVPNSGARHHAACGRAARRDGATRQKTRRRAEPMNVAKVSRAAADARRYEDERKKMESRGGAEPGCARTSDGTPESSVGNGFGVPDGLMLESWSVLVRSTLLVGRG